MIDMPASTASRPAYAVLAGSRFTAAEIAGLIQAGATPTFCRSLLTRFTDRNEWLAAPLTEGDGPHLRAATQFEPQPGVSLVAITDPEYPEELLDLTAPPPVLFLLGDPSVLRSGVGVVGSRSMTEYGSIVASLAATTAVDVGAIVVSGLARGVDATAHEVAVTAGAATLAVLGCGLAAMDDRQATLAERIIATGGAVCTESPPSTPQSPGLLIARNRIIAALSYPLVVVEGKLDSGTSHTVRAAARLGRPMVVAIPKPHFQNLPSAALPLTLAAPAEHAAARFTPPVEFNNVAVPTSPAANAVCTSREDLDTAVKVFWWLHAPPKSQNQHDPESSTASHL